MSGSTGESFFVLDFAKNDCLCFINEVKREGKLMSIGLMINGLVPEIRRIINERRGLAVCVLELELRSVDFIGMGVIFRLLGREQVLEPHFYF
jgi:hypothetical protein